MPYASSAFRVIDINNPMVEAGRRLLLFDPNATPRLHRRGLACISHAHADHVASLRSSLPKIVTAATRDIYLALRGRPRSTRLVSPGDQLRLDDTTIKVHSAGHILGSVQFSVERNGVRLVYTGDINLQSTLITEGATPIPCDILLMEATYGRPAAVFPPRNIVYTEIVEWVTNQLKAGRIPAFQVYATGKAQELIRLVNTYLTIPVVVDPTIAKVSEVYRRHGVSLNFFAANTPEGRELLRRGEYVYLTSSKLDRRSFPSHHPFSRAVATGWAKLYPIRHADKAFILSSHADYIQLLRYVQEAKPKVVLLTCGDTITFSAVLEKLNVKPVAVAKERQRQLPDYF